MAARFFFTLFAITLLLAPVGRASAQGALFPMRVAMSVVNYDAAPLYYAPLPENVVKKADEIEKLAKSVKDKMKGNY